MAELARLIGQTDPFAMGRGNVKPQPQAAQQRYQEPQYEPEQYEPEAYEPEPEAPAGPPPWMQRANARAQQPAPPPIEPQYEDEQDYAPAPVHPLHRYGAPQAPQQQPPQQAHYQYPEEQQYAEEPADPSRYDDALYGQIEAGQYDQRDPAYPDDPYAYQGYNEEPEEQPRRRGGMITVAAVLALAVIGTGGAFAYRSFVGSPRSGEPPVIKADNSPTKVVPAQSDSAQKAPDRMTFGDGSEKLVPREETPLDINARSGPRVVFPPLNQNANPPSPASVSPSAPPPASASSGTLPNNEPKRVRTLSVKGDAADAGMPPAAPNAKQPPTAPAQVAAPRTQPLAPPPGAPTAPTVSSRNPPTSANASANGPLSLSPQGGAAPAPAAEPPARVAAVAPAAAPSSGGFVVQVSSQKTEADAQASYRALQGKFPTVRGSRPPLIKRADLGEKGVFYRAMVGPFGSRDEAIQVCTNLKAAGGQCVIQGN